MSLAHYIPAHKQSLKISGILCPHLYLLSPNFTHAQDTLSSLSQLSGEFVQKSRRFISGDHFLHFIVSDIFVLVVIIDDIVGTSKG